MLLGEKYKNSLYFITAKDSTVKKCPNHLANPVNSLLWTGKKKKLKDDTFEMPLTTLTFF